MVWKRVQMAIALFILVVCIACDDGSNADGNDIDGLAGAGGLVADDIGGAGGTADDGGGAGQGGTGGLGGEAGTGGSGGAGGEAGTGGSGGAGGEAGEGGAGGVGGVGGGDGPQWMSEFTDLGCIDGQWRESWPDRDENLDDLVAGYDRARVNDFIFDVLARRYPLGGHLVEVGLEMGAFEDCIGFFLRDTSNADAVVLQLSTIVHECGHSANLGSGGFGDNAYIMTEMLTMSCAGGDTTERFGETFARSRIRNDGYQGLRPPCNGRITRTCDHYADVYLDGNPDDGNFEGGDQGFNSLLEETLQYVNSLATGYAFEDFYRGSRSERDGILTFLWYLERYLRMARLDYPDAYDHISGNECWRRSILQVWGRAWMYLSLTDGSERLGISDDAILNLVTEPELLEEISRLRQIEGCMP